MATPIFLTGLEHGSLSASGGGLFDTVTGAPTVDSAIKRTGSYSIRFYKTVAAACSVTKNVSGSPTVLVARFYLYFTTLPSVDCALFRMNSGTYVPTLRFRLSDSKLIVDFSGSGTQAGPVVTTGQWYRIDFRGNVGTDPRTIDWQVNGVDQPQATLALAASSFTTVPFGALTTCTLDAYIDDVVISATSADYPLGPGGVVGLSPNAAGTSNPGTNVIEDNTGADVDDSTNPANVELDDVPLSLNTDYIKQVAVGTGNYAEVAFADISESVIWGARGILAYMSSDTLGNEGGCIIRDSDGQETTIWGNPTTRADYSESSMFYKSAQVLTPSGGWTQAHVNALRARIGYSNDISPVPYWENLMIEVACGESAGYSLVCDGGSYVLTGQTMSPLRAAKVDADAGAYALSGADTTLLRAALLAVEAGAYALTGQDLAALLGRKISAEAGSYAVTGSDVTLIYTPGGGAYVITAEGGVYAITGLDVGLRRDAKITPEAGAYVVTGQDAATLLGRMLDAGAGAYALSGQDAALLRAAKIAIEAGAYTLTGADAALAFGAFLENAILFKLRPSERIVLVPDTPRIVKVKPSNRIVLTTREES